MNEESIVDIINKIYEHSTTTRGIKTLPFANGGSNEQFTGGAVLGSGADSVYTISIFGSQEPCNPAKDTPYLIAGRGASRKYDVTFQGGNTPVIFLQEGEGQDITLNFKGYANDVRPIIFAPLAHDKSAGSKIKINGLDNVLFVGDPSLYTSIEGEYSTVDRSDVITVALKKLYGQH